MGITVISSSNVTTATAATSAQVSGAAVDSTTGFAALLSGQLGSVLSSTLASSSTATSSNPSGTNTPDSDEERSPEELSSDPTLALLMAMPPITPPIQTSISTKFDATQANSSGAAESDITSLNILEKGNHGVDGKYSGAFDLPSTKNGPLTANAAYSTTSTSTTESTPQAQNGFPLAFSVASSVAENAAKPSTPIDETANLAGNSSLSQATSTSSLLAGTSAPSPAQEKSEISTPLHTTNWGHDFSEKIVWLAKNDQQTAQININPPQLGPVQVTLQINGDQASAVFSSPHAEVRQAIENSLPQLKEMLSSAGINLGQSDVGANLAQQNRNSPFQAPNGNRSTDENAILPGSVSLPEGTLSQPIQRGRGLVDLFA